jgi:site-specific DNA recombinase
MACNYAELAILLGVVDDVRTLRGTFAKLSKRILSALLDEDGQRILKNIRVLRERFEPEVVAKEKASRPRPAKVAKGAYRARGDDASWQMPLH